MIVKGTVHCNLHNHYPYIIDYVATVRDGAVIEYTDEVVQYGMNHMKEARDESAYMDMVTKAIDADVARQLEDKPCICIACGDNVTHVSTICEWCDDCEAAWQEAKIEEERDIRANGYTTIH